jgi:hypothetical protein
MTAPFREESSSVNGAKGGEAMPKGKSVIDMEPGDFFDPFEFTCTPELNQQYCFAEEDFHPRYITGENGEKPIAHPGFMLNMSNSTKSPSHWMPPGFMGLQAGEDNEFIRPMYVGEHFKVTWQITETWEDHGRKFRLTDTKVIDDNGDIRLRRLSKSGAYSKELAEERKKLEAEGKKPKRPPVEVPGEVRDAFKPMDPGIGKGASVGDSYVGLPRRVGFERLTTFSGGPLSLSPEWPRVNHHTTHAYAQERGTPTIFASGTQYQGYLVAMLVDMFGWDFLTTGKLSFKIIKIVYQDDVITPAFTITEKSEGADGVTYGVDIWTHNQDWHKTMIGSGTFSVR